MSKKFTLLLVTLMVTSMLLAACQPQTVETIKEVIKTVEVEKEVVTTVEVEKEVEVITTVEVEKEVSREATLAIEHFSIIEGTTWSGAHDRAGKRIAEKYPNVQYIYREEVGPELSVPYAEEMIAEGATVLLLIVEVVALRARRRNAVAAAQASIEGASRSDVPPAPVLRRPAPRGAASRFSA